MSSKRLILQSGDSDDSGQAAATKKNSKRARVYADTEKTGPSRKKRLTRKCNELKIDHNLQMVSLPKSRSVGTKVSDPSRSEIPDQEANLVIDGRTESEEDQFMGHHFCELTQEVRDCIGVHRANVSRCLKLLEQYKHLELNKLMVLRNPECVDVIRHLRRYVGNLDEWKMSEADEIEFKEHAQTIRGIANEIYEDFKKLFVPVDETRNFRKVLSDEVKTYKMNTKNIQDMKRLTQNEKSCDELVVAKSRKKKVANSSAESAA